jgi:hypothetical protein
MTLKNRLQQLEKQSAPARRIVVRYTEQADPAELDALRSDPAVTLILVEYADEPTAEDTTA